MDNLLLSENFWQLGIPFLRSITEKQLNSDSDLIVLVLVLPSDDLGHTFILLQVSMDWRHLACMAQSCVLGCTCTRPSAMLEVTWF